MALMLDNCEGILLSLDSHKSVPAPFLTKTYQLVDDPSTDHIVSWGEDDSTFVVWRPPEFARDLLPNYFKHNNFSSFVRQLNTYGFRKIVPDRWEFANEFFKKGEKHLLCEIHRRKTSQPQVSINHHHHLHNPHSPIGGGGGGPAGFYHPFSNRLSISPSDSDEQANWCDSPPLSSPRGNGGVCNNNINNSSSITALSEDNERLRRSNSMLMSELAHMKKLYNDIIYFVQNHVRPVTPSNSYPSSLLISSTTNPPSINPNNKPIMMNNNQQLLGFNCHQSSHQQPKIQSQHHQQHFKVPLNPISTTSCNSTNTTSSLPMLEEHNGNHTNNNSISSRTKLFGVSLLHSKKRLHPEPTSPHHHHPSSTMEMINNKSRLVMGKDDLGLNLMPTSY
ncbi:Heat shock factor (HSF)-type [Macleaya cordata]|uniref:Heat shock factor (HSF)-type n=1 Tax=Macleaya cordata TaxID=56857 RepID=A0A200QYV8_MACCD|nr:Heat shock factor (HSF)-type [Macleaya cordata]